MIGVPIDAAKRMQFNLPIKSIPKITLMKDLATAMHPIFWIEEVNSDSNKVIVNCCNDFTLKFQKFELQGDLYELVSSIFIIIKVKDFAKWAGLLVSGGMLGVAGYRRYERRGEATITPVKTVNDDNDNNSLTEKKELGGEVNHAMSAEIHDTSRF